MSMQWGADASGGLVLAGADFFDFASAEVSGTKGDDIIVSADGLPGL